MNKTMRKVASVLTVVAVLGSLGFKQVVCASSVYTGKKYSEIFTDNNFCARVRLMCGDKDGVISDNEISIMQKTTDLDVSNANISSLNGIELFPSVNSLLCNGNDLKTLDISKNLNITVLHCYENPDLTSINLGELSKLMYLDCCNDDLSTIDLSKNSSLVEVVVACNRNLSSLKLGSCPRLSFLDCRDDNLTSLDVSQCNNLKELSCYGNKNLTELNIGANSVIEKFNCSNCSISNLNLGYATSLKYLDVSANPIEQIDVSNNTCLPYYNSDVEVVKSVSCNVWKSNADDNSYFCIDNEVNIIPSFEAAVPTIPESELNVGDFVNRCYEVALSRQPDSDGYDSWVNMLQNGQSCGAQVGFGFIFSDEYKNKNTANDQFVRDMYSMFFGREADSEGYTYWVNALDNGQRREDVFAGFANSLEFGILCEKYGVVSGAFFADVPIQQQNGVNSFVSRLYKVCLNRLPDQGGQTGWVEKLISGDTTGTSCAYGFVFSAEFKNVYRNNSDYIKYMYSAFFGREADEDGLSYWVNKLNSGELTREDAFSGFSESAEFTNLCDSFGIRA